MKLFAIILYLISIFAGTNTNAMETELYADTAEVIFVDYENDSVLIKNSVGHMYEFYGTEDYCEGDLVSVILNDNGTEKVMDDIIVSVRYSGYWTDGGFLYPQKN